MAKMKVATARRVVWEPAGGFDPATFHVRPLSMVNALRFAEAARTIGPKPESFTSDDYIQMRDLAVAQVDGWEGIEIEEGVPAPCSDENKRAIFDANPGALSVVAAFLMPNPAMTEARKNASGDGSVSGSLIPASTAGNITSTDQSASMATGAAVAGGVITSTA